MSNAKQFPNISDWLRHTVAGGPGEAPLDAGIIEHMAGAVMQTMQEVCAGKAFALPEAVMALNRVQAMLMAGALDGQPPSAIRADCKKIGRFIAEEALEFQAASRRDGLRRV